MTLLPGGKVLDVDAYVFQYQANGMYWLRNDPSSGAGLAKATLPSSFGTSRQLRWIRSRVILTRTCGVDA